MNRNSEITRHSVPLRPHPAELKDRGYRLFQQRKGNPEIAEALGIPLNTVNRWSSKGKWKMRRQLGATKREPYIQQPATNSLGEAELESLTFAEKQSRYSMMLAESALARNHTSASRGRLFQPNGNPEATKKALDTLLAD